MLRLSRVHTAATAAVAVAACSTGPDASAGTMSAAIDGTAWIAEEVTAIRGDYSGVAISIGGEDAAPRHIALDFFDEGPGTYIMGTRDDRGFGVAGGLDEGGTGWSADSQRGSGWITVVTIDDDHVSGTFSFTGELRYGVGIPERVVADGAFDVRLTRRACPECS